MSKLVKDLVTGEFKSRLSGVTDLFVVNLVGVDAIKNQTIRKQLRDKGIHLMMVKNSLARRAAEGTPLAPAFENACGQMALVWGAADVVSLAKEVARITDDKHFAPFAPLGGVMDGSQLGAAEVKAISKWPSREEMLAKLVGQILSPGAKLASQLTSCGGALASQIKEKAKGAEEEASPAA